MTLLEQRNACHARMEAIAIKIAEAKETSELDTLEAEYNVESRKLATFDKQLATQPVTEVVPAGPTINQLTGTEERAADPRGTLEYRMAFMNLVQNGVVSDKLQKRANETTLTTDVSYLIPSTVQNKVIQTLEKYGSIYASITKTAFKGGTSIPIAAFNFTATWVEEGAVAETQKANTPGSVQFSYYLLEARVATSILAAVTTLEVFETLLVEKLIAALIKAIEQAVFTGNGTGKPTGILVDTRVPAAQKKTVNSTELTLTHWQKYTSLLPAAYQDNPNNKWYMEQGTYDSHVFGLTDSTGQLVARPTYDASGKPVYRLLGRVIEIVPATLLKSFANATGHASTGDPFVVYGDITQWILNSNMDITYNKYSDKNTNRIIDLAQLIADGKLADANAIVILKKGAS